MNILRNIGKLFVSDKPPKNIRKIFDKLYAGAFPGGEEQIAEEAEILFAALEMRVPIEDLKKILVLTKPLFCAFNSRSEDGNINEVPANIIQKSTKVRLSETDLRLIHRFYANYFGIKNQFSEHELPQQRVWDELEVIHVYDRDGNHWGSYDYKSGQFSEMKESGQRGIFQGLLLSTVVVARCKLTIPEKDFVAKLMGFSCGPWTHEYYSCFAFSIASWLSDNNADDRNLGFVRLIRSKMIGFSGIGHDYAADSKLIDIYISKVSEEAKNYKIHETILP